MSVSVQSTIQHPLQPSPKPSPKVQHRQPQSQPTSQPDVVDLGEDDLFSVPSDANTTAEPDLSATLSDPTKTSIAHLISLYGSSSSTAWLEFSRYKIWRANDEWMRTNPQAQFAPIQGYMQHGEWVYAWGNPVVGDDVTVLPAAAKAFVRFVQEEIEWEDEKGKKKRGGGKTVWCCTDLALEHVLAKKDFGMNWSAVECIHEEVLDPARIMEMTSDSYRGKEGVHAVKDLKKNLRRAERAGVKIEERTGVWTQEEKGEVERGLGEWRSVKGGKGVQIASTTGQPWIDEPHRRYLVAKHEGHIVGILILTPIHGPYAPPPPPPPAKKEVETGKPARLTIQQRLMNLTATKVNKAAPAPAPVSVPEKPARTHSRNASTSSTDTASSSSSSSPGPSPTFSRRSSSSSITLADEFSLDGTPSTPAQKAAAIAGSGTGYYLIKNAISFPDAPRGTSELLIHTGLGVLASASGSARAPKVTFGITASEHLIPVDNLSGWKITGLSKVYGKVAGTAGLLKRGDFRAKFLGLQQGEEQKAGTVPAYVCYPKEEGFGIEGIKGLLRVLRK
ncbi:hypothetical protein V5O48_008163 [Marasmius crinis-equi]|uniref:Uncharacterized protein n=1 Tax=Marasmius crinis-equi TaxID=585013 RepID=A0ABR3FEM0_9AGAR